MDNIYHSNQKSKTTQECSFISFLLIQDLFEFICINSA